MNAAEVMETPVGIGKSCTLTPIAEVVRTPVVEEFSKHVWQAFGGAEAWKDGNPICRYFNDGRFMIASQGGIECHMPESDDQVWFRLNMEVPTQKMARLILVGLPEDFDPEVYGFERQ